MTTATGSSSWRGLLGEQVVLLVATTIFAVFCIAPLASMQDNPALHAEFGGVPGATPPPEWILPLDDSYIFIRYAQQAYRGYPLQWNTGEASSGASSFLYPLVLIPGQYLYSDIQGWSKWSRAVGFLGLWLLGIAAARLVRAYGLAGPWPLATGLAVIWSGPVGLGAMAGMESALNGAALLLTLMLWLRLSPGNSNAPPLTRRSRKSLTLLLVLLISLLPLLRPENLLLALLGAGAILVLPRAPMDRWTAPLMVLPGLAVGAINFLLTGLAQPTAVVTKSWLGIAYPDLMILLKLYFLGLWTEIVPVYLGARSYLLWPPIGLLAIAVTIFALRGLPREIMNRELSTSNQPEAIRLLRPLALVWLVLVVMSPMSSLPAWQFMRHHHSGLVCAWLLAFVGAGLLWQWIGARFGPRFRWTQIVSLVPVGLLFATVSTWGGLYARSAVGIHHRHGPAASWLASNPHDLVLLLNDAGYLSLAHDGPAIDVMGLGTPEMAKAYRHGAGSMVEAVARRRPLPVIAAANLDVFRLQDLMSVPLIEGLDSNTQTVVTEIELDLLDNTVLAVDGIDFAHLASESRAELRWLPAPDPYRASFALDLPTESGDRQLQGCRPLDQVLEIPLPLEIAALRVVAATVSGGDSILGVVFVGPALDSETNKTRAGLPGNRWSQIELEVPRGTRHIRFESTPGAPEPCVESLAFL